MATILPVVTISAKARLTKGELKTVYICPKDKTHAVLDITLLHDKDDKIGDKAVVNFYISKDPNVVVPDLNSALMLGVDVESSMINPELGKIIVGSGQALSIEMTEGVAINARITGLEEDNPFINKAGRLGVVVLNKANEAQEVFRYDNPLGASVTGTMSIFNPSDKLSTKSKIWITDNRGKVSEVDLIMKADVTPGNSAFVENITLAPGERILIDSAVKGTVVAFNAVDISAVYGKVCDKDGTGGSTKTGKAALENEEKQP